MDRPTLGRRAPGVVVAPDILVGFTDYRLDVAAA